jgi:uncharacterized protein
MIIDLTDLEGSTKPFNFSLKADEIDFGLENVEIAGEIHVTGELTQHIAETDVKGKIEADAKIDCIRCLNAVDKRLTIDFDVAYVTPENFAADSEREVGADDLKTDIFSGDKIDLVEVVREQILLNIPEQILCSEDCKGLCPQCGADRNLIDCKCKESEIDPRWSALKNLK